MILPRKPRKNTEKRQKKATNKLAAFLEYYVNFGSERLDFSTNQGAQGASARRM
jgi:hypothetical protein